LKTYILYHGNCTDGFGSAFAHWLKYNSPHFHHFSTFGNTAEDFSYIPVNYNEPPPRMDYNSRVFILDFSYPRTVLEQLRKDHYELTVLDHHKTAEQELKDLSYCTFASNKSGAILAWEHFQDPSEPIPLFFQYIQDRDLWQFKLPHSKEVSIAMKMYPHDFYIWEELFRQSIRDSMQTLIFEGALLLKFQTQQIEESCAHYTIVNLLGYKIPMVCCTRFFSEVGERLCELCPESPFSMYFSIRSDKSVQCGLRSRPGSFDCSVVAKKLGGGGHQGAAGFILSMEEFLNIEYLESR
jgi:uncharacterized protein